MYAVSSKASWYRDRWPRFDARLGIGGERGKSGHVGMGIGGEGEKVGHVGFGRGVTSFFCPINMSVVKNPGSGSKMSKWSFYS